MLRLHLRLRPELQMYAIDFYRTFHIQPQQTSNEKTQSQNVNGPLILLYLLPNV